MLADRSEQIRISQEIDGACKGWPVSQKTQQLHDSIQAPYCDHNTHHNTAFRDLRLLLAFYDRWHSELGKVAFLEMQARYQLSLGAV